MKEDVILHYIRRNEKNDASSTRVFLIDRDTSSNLGKEEERGRILY